MESRFARGMGDKELEIRFSTTVFWAFYSNRHAILARKKTRQHFDGLEKTEFYTHHKNIRLNSCLLALLTLFDSSENLGNCFPIVNQLKPGAYAKCLGD